MPAFLLEKDYYYILYDYPLALKWSTAQLLEHKFSYLEWAEATAGQLCKQGYDAFIVKPSSCSMHWSKVYFVKSYSYRLKIVNSLVKSFICQDTE